MTVQSRAPEMVPDAAPGADMVKIEDGERLRSIGDFSALHLHLCQAGAPRTGVTSGEAILAGRVSLSSVCRW